MLLEKFELIFDVQTTPNAVYVAVFATFPKESGLGYSLAYLALSLFKNESSQSADEQMDVLEFVLSFFEKSASMDVAIIGDNCNVNRSVSKKVGNLILSCGSHRFQLAERKFVFTGNNIILHMNQLMMKLRISIMFGKLRPHTPLRP